MDAQQVLLESVLFKDLDHDTLEQLAGQVEVKSFSYGSYIYRQGEIDNDLYVIGAGGVEIFHEANDGRLSSICCVGKGSHFGEISLLTGKPHSVSIKATDELELLVISRDVFSGLLKNNKEVHLSLEKSLAERLQLSYHVLHEKELASEANTGKISQDSSVLSPPAADIGRGWGDSRMAKSIWSNIYKFAANSQPVLISGESGTGRRLIAKQIHLQSDCKNAPYIELDIRQFDPWIWENKLFGQADDDFLFSEGRQLGVFEQLTAGTIALCYAENLDPALQCRIARAVKTGYFSDTSSGAKKKLNARLIFISQGSQEPRTDQKVSFVEELAGLLAEQQFDIPPLRDHKRDIPQLAEYYLKQYNKEHFKNVSRISPRALGVMMNYDWPGNLTELSNVIQRAVIVSQQDEIISEQILLGLPRTEGKLLFNVLRWPVIRDLFDHRLYPKLPRAIVTLCFCFGVGALLLGPPEADRNIGITLSWYLGWPLLMISFFFLPRFWCSVCALAMPGRIVQYFIKPKRKVPAFVSSHSGWIMAFLCVIVLWVEVVWNAYESPVITAGIILSIAFGCLLFSFIYQRRAWCRYVCPLGAMNAIFSMPSILELRANRDLCANRCQEHACYTGSEKARGCPMYRHPFLVDNNRDCTLCGNCIKNCPHKSIQLNLRLAPQELWNIQNPRVSDSFLVMALAAVFFFLARHQDVIDFFESISQGYKGGLMASPQFVGSLIFLGSISLLWLAYFIFNWGQAKLLGSNWNQTLALRGYGIIPLVLGGYLAVYVKMFIIGAGRLLPNFAEMIGREIAFERVQLLTETGTTTLQHIIIFGGLICTLYASIKITNRLHQEGSAPLLFHLLPFLFIVTLGVMQLVIL